MSTLVCSVPLTRGQLRHAGVARRRALPQRAVLRSAARASWTQQQTDGVLGLALMPVALLTASSALDVCLAGGAPLATAVSAALQPSVQLATLVLVSSLAVLERDALLSLLSKSATKVLLGTAAIAVLAWLLSLQAPLAMAVVAHKAFLPLTVPSVPLALGVGAAMLVALESQSLTAFASSVAPHVADLAVTLALAAIALQVAVLPGAQALLQARAAACTRTATAEVVALPAAPLLVHAATPSAAV